MPKAKKYTELMVVTDNNHGSLKELSAPLRDKKINIIGYCAYSWNNEAAFRILTTDNTSARKVLSSKGYTVSENPTVLWETTNKPGALEKATDALHNSNVDIFCTYTTALSGARKSVVAFTTSDITTTFNILNKLG
jgi:hypothetical protein